MPRYPDRDALMAACSDCGGKHKCYPDCHANCHAEIARLRAEIARLRAEEDTDPDASRT